MELVVCARCLQKDTGTLTV